MTIMAARIVVFKVASPLVPAVASSTTIHDGTERFWRDLGVDTWREYRHPNGSPIVLQKLASVTIASVTYTLCILWALGSAPDTIDGALYPGVLAALRSASAIQADWAVAWDGTNLLTTALDADAGAAATQVKAAWPASWKAYQAGDVSGTPTGARCIAQVLEE